MSECHIKQGVGGDVEAAEYVLEAFCSSKDVQVGREFDPAST